MLCVNWILWMWGFSGWFLVCVRTIKQSSGSSVSPSEQPMVLCGSEHAESSRKCACGLCRIWKPAKHHFIADFMYFFLRWLLLDICSGLLLINSQQGNILFSQIVNDLQAGAHVGRCFGAGLYTEWDWCVVYLQVSVINSYSFYKIIEKIIQNHVIKYPVASPEGKVSNQGKNLIFSFFKIFILF